MMLVYNVGRPQTVCSHLEIFSFHHDLDSTVKLVENELKCTPLKEYAKCPEKTC